VSVFRNTVDTFFTRTQKVVDYVSQFTQWRPYEHRVLALVGEMLLPIPINRTTVNKLYGLRLQTDEEVASFYAERAETFKLVKNSEQAVVAKVGRDLYEKFFRGYTRKQWDLDPSELHASVCARIPTRTNTDDRYFTSSFQAMPREGYTAMFEKVLAHPNIEVRTQTEFVDVCDEVEYKHLIWTGPIDEYFDHRFGSLPYRSLRFEIRSEPTNGAEYIQEAATINYPSEDVAFTRITEYRQFMAEPGEITTRHWEYPTWEGEPYYPVPRPENRELYKRYERLAASCEDVTFVGRLARYQYLDMDQVVAQALQAFEGLRGSI